MPYSKALEIVNHFHEEFGSDAGVCEAYHFGIKRRISVDEFKTYLTACSSLGSVG